MLVRVCVYRMQREGITRGDKIKFSSNKVSQLLDYRWSHHLERIQSDLKVEL